MKTLKIRHRLAIWYFLSIAGIVSVFALGSWFALRASMFHSIDRDLTYGVGHVVPYLQRYGLNSKTSFDAKFSETPLIGDFTQIDDAHSNIIFQSDLLAAHGLPPLGASSGDHIVFQNTSNGRGWPARVASKGIVVNGVPLTVHIVQPLHDISESLREYKNYLVALILGAFSLAIVAGGILTKRSVAPVELIRQQAEAIDTRDLSARLHIAETDDEISRLAGTLNAMLNRIEMGFKTIQQFTADASHELRTPLSLILTACEVSLRRERPREELVEALRGIKKETRRMSSLIEQLLDLARRDAEASNNNDALDLVEIAREAVDDFVPTAERKGLSLSCQTPSSAVILGDRNALRQLFIILLDNALKYTDSGSVKVVIAFASDNTVLMRVVDTGIGIESISLDKVFDRFWRADTVRSRKENGAGLGLSIASQIVAHHGGEIRVMSELGAGTVAEVRLPTKLNI